MATCTNCGTTFELTRGQKNSVRIDPNANVYCSAECRKVGRSATKTKHEKISKICPVCSVEFTLNSSQAWSFRNNKRSTFCCSRSCASKDIFSRDEFQQAFNSQEAQAKREKARADQLLPDVSAKCRQCGTDFVLTKPQRSELRSGIRSSFFCSKTCRSIWTISQPGQQEIRQQAVREKRQAFDFLNTPEAIKKRTETLQKVGVKGGIHRGPSQPQETLANALGLPMEFKVKSGKPRSEGFKAVYSLDIAAPEAKLAIEIDGRDHRYSKAAEKDRKKERVLADLGWTVLRFTNEQVMDDLDGCVKQVLAMVESLKALEMVG